MHTLTRFALLFLFLCSGCAAIRGDGRVEERAINVTDFCGVQVGSGLHANVAGGASRTDVRLRADANLFPYLVVEVRGGELVVTAKDNVSLWPSQPIVATVSTPCLERVDASGGAEVAATGVRAQSAATFSASGGAELTVADVTAQSVSLDASGGSTLTAPSIAAQTASLEASGGSIARLSGLALDAALSVDASGGSRVTLAGRASRLDARVSGASELGAADLVCTAVAADVSGGSTLRVGTPGRVEGGVSGGSTLACAGPVAAVAVEASGGSTLACGAR